MAHLGGRVFPACKPRSRSCSETCCAALAEAPPAEACSPNWVATAQAHVEAWSACCPLVKRMCPFPAAAGVCGADGPCAKLWERGEMDATCVALLTSACAKNPTMSGCAWYARGLTACRSRNTTEWYGCASNASRPHSLVDEAANAKTKALGNGQAALSFEAYAWIRGGGFAAEPKKFVGFPMRMDGGSSYVVRLAAAATNSDPFLSPNATLPAIALPILVIFTLVCVLVFEYASFQKEKKRS
jgi:hypothetical protein